MVICDFEWDDKNAEHIAKHNVEPDEVEEVFFGKRYTYKTKEDKYIMLGKTDNGRNLLVVYAIKGDRIRVITSRDMTNSERKLFVKKTWR